MSDIRQFIRKTLYLLESSLQGDKIYFGSENSVTRFMRNLNSEVSPFINRLSDTEVSINPKAFIVEPALEGTDGMLDFFGLKQKFEFSLNEHN